MINQINIHSPRNRQPLLVGLNTACLGDFNIINIMKVIIINSPKHGRKEVLVDDEDFEYLNQFRWSAHKLKNVFYTTRHSQRQLGKQKTILMHREIMKTPINMVCDHINHNTMDNRKENLRNCLAIQNLYNKSSSKSSSSKYLGVILKKPCGRNKQFYWVSCIGYKGKTIYLGMFSFNQEGEINAAKAYNHAASKYFGEYANLNKV